MGGGGGGVQDSIAKTTPNSIRKIILAKPKMKNGELFLVLKGPFIYVKYLNSCLTHRRTARCMVLFLAL